MLDKPAQQPRETLSALVGRRIRDHRKAKGMTLAEVAARANSKPQTIQRLETGRVSISVEWVERIAAAIAVSPLSFFHADARRLSPEALELLKYEVETIAEFGNSRVATALELLITWYEEVCGEAATIGGDL